MPTMHIMSAADALEVRAILRAVRDSHLRIIDPDRARMVERALELMDTAAASATRIEPAGPSERFWGTVRDHVQDARR